MSEWTTVKAGGGELSAGPSHVVFETVVPGSEYNHDVLITWSWDEALELAHAILAQHDASHGSADETR